MGTGGDKYPDGSYIPLGYGWDVRDALEPVGLASVQHNGGWLLAGQAGASSHGAECIDRWLGSGPWDIVHVNFGLHDIDASEFVPPTNYTANLELIYSRIVPKLTATGQLIWASSSPVPYPSEYKLRNNSAVQHYNALAQQLWDTKPAAPAKGSVVTNDLYTLITRACGDTGALGSFSSCSLQRMWWGPGGRPSPLLPPPGWRPKPGSTGGVHYNARGRRMMGLATASLISQHLPTLHTAKLDDDEGGSTARAVPIKQTRVYTALEGNFSCFRIPAMVALPKAKTILAFAEARGAGLKPGCHDVTAASVVVKRSTDQGTSDGNVCCSCRSTFLRGRWRDTGRSFSSLQRIASTTTGIGKSSKRWIGNAAPTVVTDPSDGTERVVLLLCNNSDRVLSTTSHDSGHTWTPVEDISEQVNRSEWRPGIETIYTGPSGGIQLSAAATRPGRVLVCANAATIALGGQ